jgi:hypothetical protein
MIKFRCPECDTPLEIGDRMAGREIRCVECDAPIEVPGRRREPVDPGLSGGALAAFTALFLLIPCANVLVSSILYYVWRYSDPPKPRSANQINLLGFAVFGFHVLLYVLLIVIGVLAKPWAGG